MIENSNTEFKREYTDSIRKAVVAFANTDGGCIYIGVEDDGTVVGVVDVDDVQKRVISLCRDGIQPDVMMFLSCDRTVIEDKDVIRLQVQRGTDCPYYLKGKGIRPEGVYVRRGPVSLPAAESQIRKMIREAGDFHYEQERSLEQELTFKATERFLQEAGVPFGEAERRTLRIVSKDGLYTNLGLLLSDQCQHTVKVAIFSGKKQVVFRDRREFSGSLLLQVNQVIEYLDFHNALHSEIRGMKRLDSRDYPVESLREAIFNAFVHRDYGFSGSILVSVYEDRIEILSLGGLAEGVTYNDMMLGVSIPRNPKLAEIFYRLHYIEAFGTGVRRILTDYAECEEKPQFLVSDNAVKVILPNLHAEWEHPVIAEDVVQDERQGYTAEIAADEGVYQLIAAGLDSRKKLQSELGFSLTKTVNILRKLLDEGRIQRVGNGKNTRYRCK
ncbi:RNA-binding domain-containing protein [Selenomonas ruminantium]|uniref:ATP-dependent DNA helicase RecG n=1 Tax=Selenomonas ruminantium TaxID=971 RepID=A0A1K1QE20_SELRU|nr:RNA-binding domain-containing protein [Selenomonas ruminantium]SFW58184.1 ATP-dependent DNA helicase RecG [Selenomonas ruminantium]